MKNLITIILWVVTTMVVWTTSATLMSEASDLAFVAGMALVLVYSWLSYKTHCFLHLMWWKY